MKKRVGCSPTFEEHSRLHNVCLQEENVCEKVTEHPKTVKIGNINVELRSVKPVEITNCLVKEKTKYNFEETEQFSEDLQYGPGIVDRLRARFLNIGLKQQVKPVVRRFSSLESLPGVPCRVNAGEIRQNGFKSGFSPGHVKKAQSMETLNSMMPEQHIFSTDRRTNARIVVGAKVRILLKNVCPTAENCKSFTPRLHNKSTCRWDYGGNVSTPNINEDELPRPDTVKHVKKMFESPLVSNSMKTTVNNFTPRFRKIPNMISTSHTVSKNSAILENEAWPAVKKIEENAISMCAKDFYNVNKVSPSSVGGAKYDAFVANKKSDNVKAGSCKAEIMQETNNILGESSSDSHSSDLIPSNRVIPERLPHKLSRKQSDSLSGDRTESNIVAGEQIVTAVDEEDSTKKSWKKASQPSNSIIFDFRGRNDVEPHISHNLTPFGSRQAKISQNSSSKCTSSDRVLLQSHYSNRTLSDDILGEEDEEDWDEMDIGADLPLISGIVFVGENVKIGRSSFLKTRDKKLNIKFNDKTITTYEYPSENTCFSLSEENIKFDSSTAMGSSANSRLLNYTPQVLSTNDEFELGVSHLSHRSTVRSPKDNEMKEPITDILVPVDPDDTVGWSATETVDILF